jgi:hypothetical protein
VNRDDIIRMAREADLDWHKHWDDDESNRLERFAALVADYEWNRAIGIAKGMQDELQAKFEQTYMEGVIAGAAAEREACAKVADSLGVHPALNVYNGGPDWYKHGKEIAAAIRARGQA